MNKDLTQKSSGDKTPLWFSAVPSIETDGALQQSTRADVCVIGAGIAGLSTAYLLQREGRSVVVLEDGQVGSGETGRTSAHLSNALDDRYEQLEKNHGTEGARIAAESHTAAIERIGRISSEEHIACEFQFIDGYLIRMPEEPEAVLAREYEAAHRSGLTNVTWEARAPWQSYDTGRCLRFPRQAQFHPLKYLLGLADALRRRGGRIYTQAHVTEVRGGERPQAKTDRGLVVEAKAIVVATNVPIHQRVAIHLKQAAYRSYLIGGRVDSKELQPALYWDTADPYHYIRRVEVPEGTLVLIGGEDHKTGQLSQTEEPFQRLEAWARDRFPSLSSIDYRWSGQIIEPNDGVAFIGHHPLDEEHVYLATGDSGNGLTHGTIAGILLTDLIQGRSNSWEKLYHPGRVRLQATAEFVKENVNVATQYADWLTAGSQAQLASLPANNGMLISEGTTKIAAYRNTAGQVSLCSAVCPHLGCLVNWNGAEKTWDCPCHGSRFDGEGHVLNGPANSDLHPVQREVIR